MYVVCSKPVKVFWLYLFRCPLPPPPSTWTTGAQTPAGMSSSSKMTLWSRWGSGGWRRSPLWSCTMVWTTLRPPHQHWKPPPLTRFPRCRRHHQFLCRSSPLALLAPAGPCHLYGPEAVVEADKEDEELGVVFLHNSACWRTSLAPGEVPTAAAWVPSGGPLRHQR